MKTKVAYLDVLPIMLQYFFAAINGFWVTDDLDDLRMYILWSSRSSITQKRLVGVKLTNTNDAYLDVLPLMP